MRGFNGDNLQKAVDSRHFVVLACQIQWLIGIPKQTNPYAALEAQMWRRFLIWLALLSPIGLVANLPRGGGAFKMGIQWAGRPFTFAVWDGEKLVWFNGLALAGDLGLLLALIPVAWLCALLRRSAPARPQQPSPDQFGKTD
jgi:hypothetical protein